MLYPMLAVVIGVIVYFLSTIGIEVIWSLTVIVGVICIISAKKAKTNKEEVSITIISAALTVVLLFFSIKPYISI